MAMSPRLLRPIASNFDPDAAVYLNAVAVADGQQLEPAVKKAINDFVKGCKQDGIWDAIKACCILAGARTLAGALTPLKGAAPTNNGPFVSGDYNRKTGLVGNGSSKNLDTNRNNNAEAQDDHHLSVWINAANTDTKIVADRGFNGTNGQTTLGWNASLFATSQSAGWDNLGATNATFNNRTGLDNNLFGISRSSSSTYSARAKSTTMTVTKASQTPAAGNVILYSTSANAFYSDARLAFYSIGSSLVLATLNTRVSTLITAIGAAI